MSDTRPGRTRIRTVVVSTLVGAVLLASAGSAEAYRGSYAPRFSGPRVYSPYGLRVLPPYRLGYRVRSPYGPLPYSPVPPPAPPVGDGGRSYAGETICSRIAQDPPGYVPNLALWHTRPDMPGYRCLTMP
jgi:hypothetical protein